LRNTSSAIQSNSSRDKINKFLILGEKIATAIIIIYQMLAVDGATCDFNVAWSHLGLEHLLKPKKERDGGEKKNLFIGSVVAIKGIKELHNI
jgi:hypothetical protein